MRHVKYRPSIDLKLSAELSVLDRVLQEGGQTEGIRPYVVELMTRLTSGGVGVKSADVRIVQAKRLWGRGFGRAANAENFQAYLAGIPAIPESLVAPDADLLLLSLADPRPGLLKACGLFGIQHAELGYSEGDAVPFDERHTDPTEPFWFRHDDGRKNRNCRPDHCRDECTGDLLAGTAMTGAFAYLHHPDIVKEGEHIINLPGSVHRDGRILCAYLEVWRGRARLVVGRNSENADPRYGSPRFRRK